MAAGDADKLEVLAAWHAKQASKAQDSKHRATQMGNVERHHMLAAHHDDAAQFLRRLAADIRCTA